jgi:hypothetical protein
MIPSYSLKRVQIEPMNESSNMITKRMQIAALLNLANYVAKYPNFPFDSTPADQYFT